MTYSVQNLTESEIDSGVIDVRVASLLDQLNTRVSWKKRNNNLKCLRLEKKSIPLLEVRMTTAFIPLCMKINTLKSN